MHLFQVIFRLAVIPDDVRALDRGVAQPEAVLAQRGGVLVRGAAVPAVLALPDHVREVVPRGHRLVEAPAMKRTSKVCIIN